MSVIEVSFDLGQEVEIDGDENLVAIITAFSYDGCWKFQISWFFNGEHKSDWFQEWRLKPSKKALVEDYPKLG